MRNLLIVSLMLLSIQTMGQRMDKYAATNGITYKEGDTIELNKGSGANPPTLNKKRSIRIKGYDYSQAGLYFVTICCHNRMHLFGNVVNGGIELNDAGKIADACWVEIPNHFPNAVLHVYIDMPNHVHGKVELKTDSNVDFVEAENFLPLQNQPKQNGFQKMIPRSIRSIVKGFKIGFT